MPVVEPVVPPPQTVNTSVPATPSSPEAVQPSLQPSPAPDIPTVNGAASPGGKKGLNYNEPNLISKFPNIGWVANWEQTYIGIPQGVKAYPML